MEKTFTVSGEDQGKRLDVYLAGEIPALSRSRIKNLLDEGRILVDGAVRKAGWRLRAGEEIQVQIPEEKPSEVLPEDIPLRILYEDEDILVVDKPPGMAAHPGAGRTRGTLVNALLSHTKDLSSIGGPLRPGIVHRLDMDTSGVLVVAKNDSAHRSLAKQFKEHTVVRKYIALASGSFDLSSGRIDIPLGRDITHRKKISPRARKKRAAVTHWKVLKRYPGLTLLELTPETGRTHQLRVHLSAKGRPIVGDQLYGRRPGQLGLPGDVAEMVKEIRRQCLHAETLGITHPSKGTYMEFKSPPPEDMERLIRFLDKRYG